ncbi:hypothetical protein CEV34_2405 [Brucella pseudogrignonensis]|uniref:Uncharacterized protein n=1 Tax=Brucella pseudogrignonensis TaxID=419475 RepID=A0A256GGC7_9HYPH|nr:hypothetical protein CEV34_2405 [Brucella pseudogrignonensis]
MRSQACPKLMHFGAHPQKGETVFGTRRVKTNDLSTTLIQSDPNAL